MTLTATATIPGYDITPDATGAQLFFKYGIGAPGDNLAEGMSGRLDGQSVANAGPHTITVSDGTIFNLSSKQWRTHFRYPWVTDRVLLSPAQLVALRFSFPYGNPGGVTPITAPPEPTVVPYNDPNSFAGLDRGMHDTGERPDIGLQTEWAAYFMATGNADGMMQTAEAAGTAPLFYQDNATGKLFDKRVYQSANNYSVGPSYWGRPWVPASPGPGVDFALDHPPEISYLAAIATKSLWHLRNLQYWANYVLINGYFISTNGLVCIANDQARQMAWALRTVGMAEVATKYFEALGPLPAELMPSNYFGDVLHNTLTLVLHPLMNDPDLQVTRVLVQKGAGGAFAPWQQCYIGEVLAWLVLTGHTEFHAVYLWHLQGIIDFTSGKSGWPMQMPCPYWVYNGAGAVAGTLANWAAIWAAHATTAGPGAQLGNTLSQAELDAINANPTALVLAQPDGQGDYIQTTRQCLAAAMYLHAQGILDVLTACPDLPVSYNNVRTMMINLDATQPVGGYHNWHFSWRNAVVIDPAVAPAAIIQPSPVGYRATPLPPPPDPPPVIVPPDPPPAPPPVPVTLQTILAKAKAILARLAP